MSVKILVIALLVFFSSVAGASIASPADTVEAQSKSNPFCWRGPPPTEVDCNASEWKSLIDNSDKGPIEVGKCFGFGEGVYVYNYDDDECKEARGEVKTQAAAECITIPGTLDDYWRGNFERSELQSVDCNEDFDDREFSTGYVYVKDGSGQISSKPSSEHEALVASAKTFGQENSSSGAATQFNTGDLVGQYPCGTGDSEVMLSFDIGCKARGNGIIDMLFAFIRILTTGVGFALVISVIIAGVQYTTAAGDPNKTSLAKKRLVSTLLVALPLYLFTYAILNWIIPGAILQ